MFYNYSALHVTLQKSDNNSCSLGFDNLPMQGMQIHQFCCHSDCTSLKNRFKSEVNLHNFVGQNHLAIICITGFLTKAQNK